MRIGEDGGAFLLSESGVGFKNNLIFFKTIKKVKFRHFFHHRQIASKLPNTSEAFANACPGHLSQANPAPLAAAISKVKNKNVCKIFLLMTARHTWNAIQKESLHTKQNYKTL